MMFGNINFLYPELLLLLLLLPLLAAWYYYQRRDRFATLKMPSLDAVKGNTTWRGKFRLLLPVLRALAFTMLVIALARPQETLKEENINAEGIDIVLVMDLSSSMLARDFKPDRLSVSKRVAGEFVSKRAYDRVGLVSFAGEAFTQAPVTTDHDVIQEFLAKLECGILKDGTAIGMGLATAINRLKDSKAESKVIILLTDGVNNAGYVKPIMAAEIAQEFDVKVYTIGVGTTGDAST
ncbi:MAG: VWA domain-containing protein, partial [Bacteroidota bacterium]